MIDGNNPGRETEPLFSRVIGRPVSTATSGNRMEIVDDRLTDDHGGFETQSTNKKQGCIKPRGFVFQYGVHFFLDGKGLERSSRVTSSNVTKSINIIQKYI